MESKRVIPVVFKGPTLDKITELQRITEDTHLSLVVSKAVSLYYDIVKSEIEAVSREANNG